MSLNYKTQTKIYLLKSGFYSGFGRNVIERIDDSLAQAWKLGVK